MFMLGGITLIPIPIADIVGLVGAAVVVVILIIMNRKAKTNTSPT
jgi:hypothetical protein